jgi:hypothetical protein|tara:strand:- start:700 stop:1104 length:405 start_codon:yes stop_codon:yes gene_type:complete
MNFDINNLVEVKLSNPDDFLKVRETLTRIGVASKKDNNLYQSCHILHKQGRYYIVHFKELFALDGKPSNFSESDIARRNTITNLLKEWDLIEIVIPSQTESPISPISQIKVLPFKEKNEWELVAKYNIGKKKPD